MGRLLEAGIDPLLGIHLLLFAGAALACFGSLHRTHTIPDPDTRRGLRALLGISGIWAGSYVGFLLSPTPQVSIAFYLLGLAAGLTSVGAWLYFCSAYTGRTLHHNRRLRRVALAIFLIIVSTKLTNPFGLYYTTTPVESSFANLAIHPGVLHWLTMALAYALAFVGYFMLLERFYQIDADTRPLVALVSLTAIPALLDVTGATTPYLLNLSYEPLGVAAFAVGVLFLYREAFGTIQLTSGQDSPAIYLDDGRHIREANRAARALYPALDGATGQPLADVLPEVAAHLDGEDAIVEWERAGHLRYYRVSSSPFTAGDTTIGELLTVTDVTEAERYRRELERKTEQLESFTSVVAHDLRNPLSVAEGYLEVEQEQRDSDTLVAVADALNRMEAMIEDLLTLAREGQELGETEAVSLAEVVEQCWQDVETAEATITVEEDVRVVADVSRLQQLLENLFRNAVEHAGPSVSVTVGSVEGGFYVADDGAGIPVEEREEVFEAGFSTASEGTGFGLSIVEEVVEAHGWEIRVVEGRDGGARFEVTGVETPMS